MANAQKLEFCHHNLVTDLESDLTSSMAADVLAIPVTHPYVAKTSGADAEALTLANGTPGQVLVVHHTVDGGGTCTITPATKTGWATAVLNEAGDMFTFLYVNDTMGWIVLGATGVAAQPVISI